MFTIGYASGLQLQKKTKIMLLSEKLSKDWLISFKATLVGDVDLMQLHFEDQITCSDIEVGYTFEIWDVALVNLL